MSNNKEKFAANIQRMNELQNRESVDWQARYYRQKNQEFYTSSSYIAPSAPEVVKTKKRVVAAALKQSQKVRHNPAAPKPLAKYVVINGIPHKRTENGYVALTAVESK
jgi:hypothetical protein